MLKICFHKWDWPVFSQKKMKTKLFPIKTIATRTMAHRPCRAWCELLEQGLQPIIFKFGCLKQGSQIHIQTPRLEVPGLASRPAPTDPMVVFQFLSDSGYSKVNPFVQGPKLRNIFGIKKKISGQNFKCFVQDVVLMLLPAF